MQPPAPEYSSLCSDTVRTLQSDYPLLSVNIAYFLIPKSSVAYLYDDFTFRQGLEKMRHHGYTAIPVITRDGRYMGTVSEGDFLWRLLSEDRDFQRSCSMRDMEQLRQGIGLVTYAQRDPLVEYKKSAFQLFEEMNRNIRYDTALALLSIGQVKVRS